MSNPDAAALVETRSPAPPRQAPFPLKLAIVLFIVAYLLGALWLLLDFWVLGAAHLRQMLGLPPEYALPMVFLSAIHAMLGAILGAGLLDLVSFHRHSAAGDFQARHVWGYFFAPLLAAVLGLVVFALLQSGLLVFAGGSKGEADDLARLGYLAVGFLSGFGWEEATESIRRIVQRFFSSAGEVREGSPASAEAAPAPAPQAAPSPPSAAP